MKKTLLAMSIIAAASTLTACGGSSSNDNKPDPDPTPTNNAPTDITLSAATVAENAMAATVGSLTTTDDSGDTHTYAVNDERFVVEAGELKLAADQQLNFESEAEVTVTVTSTDQGGLSTSKDFAITVTDVLDTFNFTDAEGNSTVTYSGQIARHVLIAELNNYLANEFTTSAPTQTREEVLAKLNSYFAVSSEDYELYKESDPNPLAVTFKSGTVQKSVQDISSSHKNLVGKIAGNDADGQHKDWRTEFVGWGEKGSITPQGLVETYFGMLADLAVSGEIRQDPNGNAITPLYVTEEGLDLKQLVQKFLLGAVAYSQGADDYLEYAAEDDGKGLRQDNTALKEGKVYTNLEHNFDEGFGYFGAARNYLDYSDDEIASKGGRDDYQGSQDTNGDGEIDLNSEYNFGNSTNAAKRDRGAKDNTNPTNYTADAFNNFLAARKIIQDNRLTTMSDADLQSLITHTKAAVDAWEHSIVATVVHYINDTTDDLELLKDGSADFDFATMAKHWSEMKGFALGLQFNPDSKLTDEQFAQVHTLMADKPEIGAAADIEAYIADLATARGVIQTAYGYDDQTVENW